MSPHHRVRWFLAALALLLTACAPGGDELQAPADPDEPAEAAEPGGEEPDPLDAETPEGEVEQPTGLPAKATIQTPVRAVWVHLFDDTLKTREGIERLVDDLVEAEATMVIAQVVRRHDAYYRSQVLPKTADPALEDGLDILDELVPLAHANGIEVHAWVSVAPTWHRVYEELPAPSGWLPAEHGRTAPEDDRWVTRTADGDWSEYLDPALSEVREHITAVAMELASATDVDGIHLDYVRYESERHGYHPDALERYQREAQVESVPRPDDPAFVAWRRAQTRGVLEQVSAALDTLDRRPLLSAAVISWGPGPAGTEDGSFERTRAGIETFQDWPAWARDGLVDVLFPMNYFRAHVDEQAEWFEQWLDLEAELATATDTLVVPGIGGWLNEHDATIAQVGAATRAADGAAVYSYQQPTDGDSPKIWRDLAEVAWSEP